MENYSLADLKAVVDDGHDGFGGGNYLWIILVFLFFLAFNGNGLGFGNNGNAFTSGMAQVERDVLQTSCATQKEILESRYTTQLGFQSISAQMATCCCDLKNAIHAEGEETRALITANTIQELRDRLQTANNALTGQTISNNVINAVRPFPIPSYNTCSPYTPSYYGNYGCGCGNI